MKKLLLLILTFASLNSFQQVTISTWKLNNFDKLSEQNKTIIKNWLSIKKDNLLHPVPDLDAFKIDEDLRQSMQSTIQLASHFYDIEKTVLYALLYRWCNN